MSPLSKERAGALESAVRSMSTGASVGTSAPQPPASLAPFSPDHRPPLSYFWYFESNEKALDLNLFLPRRSWRRRHRTKTTRVTMFRLKTIISESLVLTRCRHFQDLLARYHEGTKSTRRNLNYFVLYKGPGQ